MSGRVGWGNILIVTENIRLEAVELRCQKKWKKKKGTKTVKEIRRITKQPRPSDAPRLAIPKAEDRQQRNEPPVLAAAAKASQGHWPTSVALAGKKRASEAPSLISVGMEVGRSGCDAAVAVAAAAAAAAAVVVAWCRSVGWSADGYHRPVVVIVVTNPVGWGKSIRMAS
jgi:hypothetical protein